MYGNPADNTAAQGHNRLPAEANAVHPLPQGGIGLPSDIRPVLPGGTAQSMHYGNSVSKVSSDIRTQR